jgi:O-antigen/teichoic acid export membrane protein
MMAGRVEGQAAAVVERPRLTDQMQLSRDAIVFGLGSVTGKAIGFVMLPVVARLLSPEDLGRLDVLSTMGSSMVTVLLLGLDVAVLRMYTTPGTDRPRLMGTWYSIAIAVTVAAGSIIAVAAPVISGWLFGTRDQSLGVVVIGLTVVLGTVQVLNLNVARLLGRPGTHAFLNSAALVSYAILAIGALAVGPRQPSSVLVAYATALGIVGLVGLLAVRQQIAHRPDGAVARDLLRVGLPLAPAVALVWVGEFLHRAILVGAAAPAEVGYLAVAIRVASVAGLVVGAFQLAWQPVALRDGAGRTSDRRQEAHAFVAAISIATVLLGLAAPVLVDVLAGVRYRHAVPALELALLSVLLQGAALVTATHVLAAASTRWLAGSIAVGVAGGLTASVMLAPVLGAVGTAAALVIGQGLIIATGQFVLRTRAASWLGWRTAGTAIAAATVLVGIAILPDLDLLVRVGLLAALVAAMAATGGLWALRALVAPIRR